MSAGLKTELETVVLKVQTIVVDAVLTARTELMGEFKWGEHSNWDTDEEIRTWDKRAAVLAGGEDASDEEDEEEVAPAVGSPKPKEMEVNPKQVEPDVGAEAVVSEHTETAASAEDLAKD